MNVGERVMAAVRHYWRRVLGLVLVSALSLLILGVPPTKGFDPEFESAVRYLAVGWFAATEHCMALTPEARAVEPGPDGWRTALVDYVGEFGWHVDRLAHVRSNVYLDMHRNVAHGVATENESFDGVKC
jgi:hypothetical protein